jgi:CheY-like chemotaxis protein/signal transduction histidine kinase/HAMP domain-containing protein
MSVLFQFKRLRSQITAALLIVSVIPLAIVSTTIYRQRVEVIKQNSFIKLQAIRDLKVEQVNNWLEERIADVSVISSNFEVRNVAELLNQDKQSSANDSSIQMIYDLFHRAIKVYGTYEEIFIVGARTGRIVISTDKSHNGEDRSDDIRFIEPMRTKGLYIRDIYFSKTFGKPSMAFSIPIFNIDDQEEITGIMVARVGLEQSLYDLLLNRTGMGKTGETLIVNQDVIALNELRWLENAPLKLSIKAEPAVLAAQGKTGIIETVDYREEQVLAAYTHIKRMNWGFIAKQDLSEIYSPITRMVKSIFLLFVIAVITVTMFSFFLAGTIVHPILAMARISTNLQKGDLSARNRIKRPDELGYLAQSFDDMADFMTSQRNVDSGCSKITDVTTSSTDLSEFPLMLLEALMQITASNTGAYYSINTDRDTFNPVVSIGMKTDLLQPFDASMLEGEFGAVLTTGKINRTKDVSEDTHFVFKAVAGTALPKEIVTIPILIDGKVQVILSLASLNAYSDTHLQILEQSWIGLNTSLSNLLANDQTRKLADDLTQKNQELGAQAQRLQSQAREMEEQAIELETQRTQVEEANQLKSEFLSNMSHELRTPLNSIIALSEIMSSRGPGKNPEKDAEYMRIIERNGHNLLNLINDILDLSKIEAGRMDFILGDFAPSQVVNRVFNTLKALAEEKNLSINVYADDLPNMHSDEGKIHQLLLNLVSNAIKFTHKGQVDLNVTTTKENIFFAVKDTGIGIAQQDIQQIFEEFRQVDGSTTRKHEGTGLGLAICHKLSNLLGGNIKVQSTPEVGSTFTLVLPVRCSETSDIWNSYAPKKLEKTVSLPSKMLKRTILVVDDETEVCKLIQDYFVETGYDVVTAHNGTEALQIAHEIHPFAITLDVLMPDIDGWEVLRKLKASKATDDIPVIMVSMSDDKATGMALGATGYLVKPIIKELLLTELDSLTRSRTIKDVLVVDDDPVIREYLEIILQEKKYRVKSASGGEEALNLISKQSPDAIVLDLMMPDIDGFTVLNILREDPATHDIPVIVVTAKDLTPEEQSRLTDTAQQIIAKGAMDKDRLLMEIESALVDLETQLTQKTLQESIRILIIEDNEVAAMQISSALEGSGYEVDVASGGAEGLESIRHAVPDAVVLDLMMPEMDGFDVLNHIRSTPLTAKIPVLVITAKELTSEDRAKLEYNNVQELIQKGSVNRNELVSRVNQLFGTPLKPIQSSSSEETPVVENIPTVSGVSRQGETSITEKTILVVEDNPDNMFTITELLGEMDCEIITAEDGLQGVQSAKESKPHLILMDIQLPELSGLDATKQIKAIPELASIPIIAMTAKAMKGDKENILAAGCDGYISKPLDTQEVIKVIHQWLG